jgi:hypothetical protein
MFTKSKAAGLFGIATIVLFLMSCESNNGGDPYLCIHTVNQMVLISKTDGATPLGPGIPFNILKKLVITDAIVQPTMLPDTTGQQQTPFDIKTIGKICFQP